MNQRSKPILLILLLVGALSSCKPEPKAEIVAWDAKNQIVSLRATRGDVDLSAYTLQKAGTKTIRSLLGITLKEGVITPILLTGNFLSKSGNVFYLNKQIMVDKAEDLKK